MYIKSHHVSQSMGHEKSVCTRSYGIIHIAFHESQIFQTLGQHFAYIDVHLFPGLPGARKVDGMVMAGYDNVIYILLAAGKTSADRNCTCEIRAIVIDGFSSGIGQHQLAGLQDVAMIMVVQGFSVLGEDGGK